MSITEEFEFMLYMSIVHLPSMRLPSNNTLACSEDLCINAKQNMRLRIYTLVKYFCGI